MCTSVYLSCLPYRLPATKYRVTCVYNEKTRASSTLRSSKAVPYAVLRSRGVSPVTLTVYVLYIYNIDQERRNPTGIAPITTH